MSDLHVDLVRQEMEENGELDFIRAHVAAAAGETPAPAPADTAEAQIEEVEDSAEEEVPADVGIEAEAEEVEEPEDGVIYLDLDPETQALLDEKYKGDLSAMLKAAREGQSLIGRQGSELGDLRKELADFRKQVELGLAAAQPYPEWPDEFDEGPEATSQLRNIAETAFDRGDMATFQRAVQAWFDNDDVSASLYVDLKQMQMAQAAPPVQQDDTVALKAGVESIRSKYPQFQNAEFQAQVAAELDKTPSLKAVLWEGVPGVSVQERLNILDEAAQRVVSRQTAETTQAARKRVAIRTSEEAREARVAAQVVRGQTARETAAEPEPRTVPLGDTGMVLDLDRMNQMLSPEDRI
jgi:hypothetical protein